MLEYSKYQLDLFNFAESDSSNGIVEAVAGSGKTHSLVKTLEHIKGNAIFLAFNRALRYDQPVMTPFGWRSIESINIGDLVSGSNGKPYKVIKVYHLGIRPMMEICFSDGTTIIADENHLWKTETILYEKGSYKSGESASWRYNNRWKVRTTLDISKTINLIHRVPHLSAPVEMPEKLLPVDPYLLGALLGDGSFKYRSVLFANTNPEIIYEVERLLPKYHKISRLGKSNSGHSITSTLERNGRWYSDNNILNALRDLGLQGHGSNTKFIPKDYLFSSISQRLSLLRGLMDTDGCSNGVITPFITTSKQLADDMVYLAQSLGGIATIRLQKIYKDNWHQSYYVNIRLMPDMCPFKVSTKVERWVARSRNEQTPRKIVSVKPVQSDNAVCISIDSPDHLFLTSGMILTHNSISDELATKVPSNTRAATFHSVGRAALYAQNRFLEMDDRKVEKASRTILESKGYSGSHVFQLSNQLNRIISMVRATLTEYNNPDNIKTMFDHYGLDFEDNEELLISLVPHLMDILNADKKTIDFGEMIYRPIIDNIPFPHYDNVFVDESQDLSKDQQELVTRLAGSGGRIIAVGDRSQAIYGWRGADYESMNNLIIKLQAKTLPLSICYRCPVSHIKLAQGIVPRIEAAPNAIDGIIDYMSLEQAIQSKVFEPGILVICRTNAPLITLAYKLIKSGIPTKVRGRDIGTQINTLVKKIDNGQYLSMPNFLSQLNQYSTNERANLVARDAPQSKIDSLLDRVETIYELSEGCSTIQQLISTVNNLFSDDDGKGFVICSSVHRAKGLEADTVIVINPSLMPMKTKQEWEHIQELNIKYVALTRSKNRLIFIDGVSKRRFN